MIWKFKKYVLLSLLIIGASLYAVDNAALLEQLKNDKSLQAKIMTQSATKDVMQESSVAPTVIMPAKNEDKTVSVINNETLQFSEKTKSDIVINDKNPTSVDYYKDFTPFFYENQVQMVKKIENKQVSLDAQKLERFGVNFFTSNGQAIVTSGAPDDYVMSQGDTLKIAVYGVDGFETELTVNKEGKIIISNVGAISVRGLEYSQVKKVIKSKLWATYPNSDVIVTIGNMSPFSVSVVGEVKKPGMYTLSALSKVKDALIASGGVSENGTMRNIVVKRNGKVAAVFDLYKLLRDGNDNGDIVLRSGDIIHIPLTKKQVWLSGNVKNPAIYELGKNENLQDLLYFSGGVNSDATQSAKITRSNKGQKELFEAKLDDKFSLADQDKIVIGKIADVLNNEVTLAGNVYRKEAISIVKDETVGSLFAKLIKEYGQEKILMPNSDMNYFLVKRVDVNTLQEVILSGNLANAIKGEKSSDVALKTSDKIYIFNKSMTEDIKFVSVNGEVLRSGKFKYFSGMTLADALKDAVIVTGKQIGRAHV